MDPNILGEVLDPQDFVTDPEALRELGTDWTRQKADPLAAVFPRCRDDVVRVVRFCWEHELAIVPSGGRTGLAGGAVARAKEVVLSLSRMNRVRTVDRVGMFIEAEAGVPTQVLQERAAASGLFYPLDLASKGSCQLGGNIATNAGGLKFIRFGGMREQVLGLEVVLADGRFLDLNHSLRKDNCGLDLRQLFIGSEGTLGIITAATVRLVQCPDEQQVVLLAAPSFAAVCNILEVCNQRNLRLSAFEFFTAKAHQATQEQFPNLRCPFQSLPSFFVAY